MTDSSGLTDARIEELIEVHLDGKDDDEVSERLVMFAFARAILAASVAGRAEQQEQASDERIYLAWDEAGSPCSLELFTTIVRTALKTFAAPPSPPVAAGGDDGKERVAIIDQIAAEVERAMRKFPTWPTDPLHAVAVLGEEFGELTKAMLQLTYEPHKTSAEEVRTEATQTAAMALRLLASLDAYEYRPGIQHAQPRLSAVHGEQHHG